MNSNTVSVPFVIDISNLKSLQVKLRDMTYSLKIVKELEAEGKRVCLFTPNLKHKKHSRH